MSIIINRITIELYQEADNNVGSEHAEIIVKPTLIGLFKELNNEKDYFLTFKSVHGFSFDSKEELIKLFCNVEKIIDECKNEK